ncbi:basic helix-loop-helix protein [Podospora pseudocomata]|uniref:Basic helix-loop-helix protein n=1 Tax=Podospora pseudocomata TaxID=2093779 RepID=A0ABR0G435_9PEZI|nr:basic helix-loop-helix protein [Podospora pseudocomata]
MAATVGIEQQHTDLSEITTSPGHKRKRNTESISPDSRRSKRPAPPATMNVTDSEAQAFLENTAVSIAQAAHDQVNVDDFSVLAQATADHAEEPGDANNATSTAAAALNMYPSLHVPQPTEETFVNQQTSEPQHDENAFNISGPHPDGLPAMPRAVNMHPQLQNGVQQVQQVQQVPQEQRYTPASNPKPAVGSEEWHKMRKDNHKEVERRRRETINEGINELAKIVPGCEKNKGSILQRAVSFITQLKENETQNIEKWTLEKLLTEQAIAELSQSNDKLKFELDRALRELELWKSVAQNAGLKIPQNDERNASS